MAEGKRSFLLYCDLIHMVNKMPNDKAGELFKHILEYVNDNNPVTEDLLLQLAFEPIKQQLKRDLIKYQSIKDKNSANARKRWDATACEPVPLDAKHADSVNDSDTDNDSDKEKEETLSASVEYLYGLYPTTCPVKKVSTGKGEKCKAQIRTLLKKKSKEEIEGSIKYYLLEQAKVGRYIMNFKTLLNNLPETNTGTVISKKEPNLVYYRWADESREVKRHIEKEKADAFFANRLEGGYIPILL